MSAAEAICLTEDEIVEITGKKRPSAQLRELNRLMIDAKQRGDGKVIVFRQSLPSADYSRKPKPVQPNYDALK